MGNTLRKHALVVLTCSLLIPALSQAQDEETMDADAEYSASDDTEYSADATTATDALTSYKCSLNGLVRRVEIAYEAAPAKVPCAVYYYKDNEAPDESSTLWSAQNMEGYCEEKAGEFVQKLQSWGWSCD